MINKIQFDVSPYMGYQQRTIQNAMADATIAFAMDFGTNGEKLTRRAVERVNKKLYIPINLNAKFSVNKFHNIIETFNFYNVKSLNIAGNGIYTLSKFGMNQCYIDDYVYEFLKYLLSSPFLKNKIHTIRSGGQTGVDEAGLKAGVKLNIERVISLCPKGWAFRDIKGIDHYNETEFKNRFLV